MFGVVLLCPESQGRPVATRDKQRIDRRPPVLQCGCTLLDQRAYPVRGPGVSGRRSVSLAIARESVARRLALARQRPGLELLTGRAAVAEVVDGDARRMDVKASKGTASIDLRPSSVAKPTVTWAM